MSTVPKSTPDRPSAAEGSPWWKVVLTLERAQKQVESLLTEVAELSGLAPAEAITLMASESSSGVCQQGELGRRLGCSPGHVSGVVERLRVRGLMIAERLPHDRRRQCWRLTDAGRRCVAEIWRAWQARLSGVPLLSPDTLTELTERLEALETLCRASTDSIRPRLADGAGGPRE